MNLIKDILPEGMQVGFRPEKVYLKEVEEEHVEISAKDMLPRKCLVLRSSTP